MEAGTQGNLYLYKCKQRVEIDSEEDSSKLLKMCQISVKRRTSRRILNKRK